MPIRMTHPQHGATHAYDKADVERLEKLGWSVEVKEEPKRGPGRPPKAK
jgi:hypothetical protein